MKNCLDAEEGQSHKIHMGHHHSHDEAECGHNHDHHHDHDQAHGHEGLFHSHDHTKGKNQNLLALAAILTGLFMAVEITGGVISGSLALIADAGHMLTDFAALTLAWFGFVLAKRPATASYTYGFDRFLVLCAFINGLSLFAITIWICVEALGRFQNPSEVLAGPMLVVAIIGLLVNCLVFWLLTQGDKENLNMRGAILHVLGDLLGSVAAIIAAFVIMATGWMPIDPLLSVVVAVLILRSAYVLIKESGRILLQGAPKGLDRVQIKADLLEHIPELVALEHIHLWSVTEERPMISIEAFIREGADVNAANRALKKRLKDKFHLSHVSLDMTQQKSSEQS